MPEDHWTPRADVIDVTVSVRIYDVRAQCPVHKGRSAAYRAESPDGRIHSAGEETLSALLQLMRALAGWNGGLCAHGGSSIEVR